MDHHGHHRCAGVDETVRGRLDDGVGEQEPQVALLAVDPSSPRTGGALLGDRIRMSSVDNPTISERMFVRSPAFLIGQCAPIVEDMAGSSRLWMGPCAD